MQMPVENHPQGPGFVGTGQAHGQAGVVRQHGAHPDQDGVVLGAQQMGVRARGRARDETRAGVARLDLSRCR